MFTKMKFIFTLIILSAILNCSIGCINNTQSKLIKVDNETLMKWVKTKTFPMPANLLVYDSTGRSIDIDSLYLQVNPRDIKRDYYVNIKGDLVKMVLYKATEKDKEFFDLMNNLESKVSNKPNKENIILVPVDCSDKKNILEAVFKRDQQNRENGLEGIDEGIDQLNLQIVVSLFSKCKKELFNDLDPIHGSALFYTIQHSNEVWMREYLPYFKKAVPMGIITNQQIALLTDRLLMNQNKPQLYGSQIRNGELYQVDNIDSVRNRRKKIGMIELEKYLDLFK